MNYEDPLLVLDLMDCIGGLGGLATTSKTASQPKVEAREHEQEAISSFVKI